MTRNCKYCTKEIHPMRLDVLPNTKTCMKCSKEGKRAGRFTFKRSGEDIESTLTIHDQEEYQKIVKVASQYNIKDNI